MVDSKTIKREIIKEARRQGVDPDLMLRLVKQESGFNPKAKSKVGASGLFQLMPATAREMGVKDPFDYKQNIKGGIAYFKKMLNATGGNVQHALAAYNAGLGNVQKYKGIPPFRETKNYVRNIMGMKPMLAQIERTTNNATGGASDIMNTNNNTSVKRLAYEDILSKLTKASAPDVPYESVPTPDLLPYRELPFTEKIGNAPATPMQKEAYDIITNAHYTANDPRKPVQIGTDANGNPIIVEAAEAARLQMLANQQEAMKLNKQFVEQTLPQLSKSEVQLGGAPAYQRLMEQYEAQKKLIQNNPLLNMQGYSNINPANIADASRMSNNIDMWQRLNERPELGDLGQQIQQRELNRVNNEYLNKYGLTRDEYMQQLARQRDLELAAQDNMIKNLMTMTGNNVDLVKAVVQGAAAGNKEAIDFLQAMNEKMITAEADMAKAQLGSQAQLDLQKMKNYGDLANRLVGGEIDYTKIVNDAIQNQNENVLKGLDVYQNAQNIQRGQTLDALTKAMEANTGLEKAALQAETYSPYTAADAKLKMFQEANRLGIPLSTSQTTSPEEQMLKEEKDASTIRMNNLLDPAGAYSKLKTNPALAEKLYGQGANLEQLLNIAPQGQGITQPAFKNQKQPFGLYFGTQF